MPYRRHAGQREVTEHPDTAKDESGDAQNGKTDVDDLQCRIHGIPIPEPVLAPVPTGDY